MKKRFLTLIEVLICFSLIAVAISPLLFFLQLSSREQGKLKQEVDNHIAADKVMQELIGEFYRGAIAEEWIEQEKTFAASKWLDLGFLQDAFVSFKSKSKPLEKEGRRIYLVEVAVSIGPLDKQHFEKRFFLPCICE